MEPWRRWLETTEIWRLSLIEQRTDTVGWHARNSDLQRRVLPGEPTPIAFLDFVRDTAYAVAQREGVNVPVPRYIIHEALLIRDEEVVVVILVANSDDNIVRHYIAANSGRAVACRVEPWLEHLRQATARANQLRQRAIPLPTSVQMINVRGSAFSRATGGRFTDPDFAIAATCEEGEWLELLYGPRRESVSLVSRTPSTFFST